MAGQNDKPRIFISYARIESPWVTGIVRALEANGFDVWLDQDDIPKAEDWEQEIIRNITRVHAFVFMISPASVASGMCNREIEHALKNGKRIIPVFINQVKEDEVRGVMDQFLHEGHRQEIGRRNFIFCRKGMDDFPKAIEEIRQAFYRDHDWVIFHTRLQEKAQEWDGRKDHSRLLRGAELAESAQKLAAAANKDPLPTDLQRQYVLESQEAAARARRQTTIGLAIAFTVTSVLCVAAVAASFIAAGQRNLAVARENQRATAQALAEEQANIALSRQLVAEAQLVYNQQANGPLIASLLAIESELRVPNAAADEIIRNSAKLLLPPFRNIPMQAGDTTLDIAFSPDGRWIAAGDFDHTARVWEVESGEEIALLRHADRVYRVQFSPDGQRLYTSSGEGTVRAWEIASGEQVMQIEHGPGTNQFTLSPDGTRTISGGADGVVQVWNTETAQRSWSFKNNDAVAAVDVSPDGERIAATTEDNSVIVWDLADGQEIFHRDLGGFGYRSVSFSPDSKRILLGGYYVSHVQVWDIESEDLDFELDTEGEAIFSPDGEIVAVSYRSGDIDLRDAHTGELVWSAAHDFTVQAMSFSPDGRYLASSSDDGSTRLWEISSGREAGRMLQAGVVITNAFSPDGKLIAAAGSDQEVHLWHVPSPSIQGSLWQSPAQGRVFARVDPAGRWIASWDASTGAQLIDLATNAPKMLIDNTSPLFNMEFSPDSEWIATSAPDGEVCTWSLSGGQKIACRMQAGLAEEVLFSPDSKWVASTEDRTIHIWEAGTGQEITALASNYPISALAFCPGRAWMAVGSKGNHKIELWDILASEKITELQHNPSVNITGVTCSADGKWLISSGIDGTARVWDLETLREQSRLTYDPHIYLNRAEVLTTKISPDQKKLVSVNTITHMTANNNPTTLRESEIRVWDLLSGQIISQMVHPAWVNDIGWSPDGQSVFSVGQDGIVSIWDAAGGSEIAHLTYDSPVIQFQFTPDGRQILSIQADGTYGFSNWQSGDIVAGACSRMPRNLTLLEWGQYFGSIAYHATCPDLPLPTQ